MKWAEVDQILRELSRYDVISWVEDFVYKEARQEMAGKAESFSVWKMILEGAANRLADNIENVLEHPRPIHPVDIFQGDWRHLEAWAVAEVIREERKRRFNKLKGTGVSNETRTES